jgi:hypothetical protein
VAVNCRPRTRFQIGRITTPSRCREWAKVATSWPADPMQTALLSAALSLPTAPQDRPWMWASGHNGDIKRAAYGYEATRGAAMAAFAKSWRRTL